MAACMRLRPAQKLGLAINSIAAFEFGGRGPLRMGLTRFFHQLIESQAIDKESIVTDRICGPHEATAVTDQFAAARVDLIVVANVAFPNGQVFLTLASRAAAQDLLARGPQTVMVKRGERGSMVATRAGVTEFPAFRVNVVDSTCAGDACAAGFLLGISRGWTLAESVRLANAAGALCTTQLSHRGIVSLEDTQRFIEAQSR